MSNDPFGRLVAANPFPTPPAEITASLSDGSVVRAITVTPRPRRSRPIRSRPAVASAFAVAVASLVLFAGSALGISFPFIDFSGQPDAPHRVVEDFASLAKGAPAGMDPNVISGETRVVDQVSLADAVHTLWVAPTSQGGLCYLWSGLGGGCDRVGTVPLDVTGERAPGTSVAAVSDSSIARIQGFVHADYASSVELQFADGKVVYPTIAWVSKPINAGFFLYDIPAANRATGSQLIAATALDSNGNTIATQRFGALNLHVVPADAIGSARRQVSSVDTPDGRTVIWEAPTHYGGTCRWLEIGGMTRQFAPCLPTGYPVEGLSLTMLPQAHGALIAGTAGSQVSELQLTYEDGFVDQVAPKGGNILYSVPSGHYEVGHRLEKLAGLDQSGNVIPGTVVSSKAMSGGNPCMSAYPLPVGKTCP